ncbi:MAG: hypothetical protein SFU56_21265 [Capsulimonadales bacterium]|nr:hypothetical protein [Capsulimonadales bacterium]
MQNSTTVHIKRSSLPLFGLVTALVGAMITLPLCTGNSFSSPTRQEAKTTLALTQPVYEEFSRATVMLRIGDGRAAGTILDHLRTEPLRIVAGGYDSGIMSEDSPTTILMRLGRAMRQEADECLEAGRYQDARLWVARLRALANQALRTPEPTYDALQMGYFMETLANRLETRIWTAAGDTGRAKQADARTRRIAEIWNRDILPELSQRTRANTEREMRRAAGRFSDATNETAEKNETAIARTLIRVLAAEIVA